MRRSISWAQDWIVVVKMVVNIISCQFCSMYTGSQFASRPNSKFWYWSLKPYGLGPAYLKDCFLPHGPTTHPLWKPCFEGPHYLTRQVATQERVFLVVVQKLWNSLPSEICLSPFIIVFHQQVKTFCFAWHSLTDSSLFVCVFVCLYTYVFY